MPPLGSIIIILSEAPFVADFLTLPNGGDVLERKRCFFQSPIQSSNNVLSSVFFYGAQLQHVFTIPFSHCLHVQKVPLIEYSI